MQFNETCYLGTLVTTRNEFGDIVKTLKLKKAFCEFKSITRQEFYLANNYNMKPSMLLNIRAEDYNGQEYVKYNKELFKVLKTYSKSKNTVELTLYKDKSLEGIRL